MTTAQFSSVPDMFFKRVSETPDRPAYQYPKGDDGWAKLTWQQSADRVRAIASGLLSLGIELEQRVAILASTRMEWVLADLGILSAGGATTTVYPSNTPAECQYILADSDTRAIFAEDEGQVAKLVEVKDQLPNLKKVIIFDGSGGHDGWVITLAELEEIGRKRLAEKADELDGVLASLKPDHLATLIYTSGTTGQPKGVELVHDCWIFTGTAVAETGILNIEDHQYLWLPLSHSFGKVLEAVQLVVGFETTVDGRIPKLVENLAVVKPTFMAAAPRIFEKVYNKVITGAQDAGGMKYKIFTWAMRVGREVSQVKQQGKDPAGLLGLKYRWANKLVFSKLKNLFGGRVRFFISGSAPLSRDIAEFFHAAGVLILEGYGLTESSAASFVNRPEAFKFGTVGKAVGTTELRIAPEDGEILMRGRGIMRGYHNKPDMTKEVLADDGWFATGDIGEVDDEGFLKITDRKKDLIKTSGGKYVAPQMLEGKLKALCPYVSQVIVHGDKRNFCTALITIDEESIQKWAQDSGLGSLSYADLTQHAKVREIVQHSVDDLNSQLASYETIKKFAILDKDLSIEEGELTPSLKVKRKVVEKKHVEILDGFYAGALK
ncbi:MAG: long-chain fatty acid--CoA ligase [Myxococcales bacterium]|nr:long-chain fatty acid--CoA ligase [Myxococcales bacterium]